jgi:hypothetical protein
MAFIEHLLQDGRFALRQLRKSPGFAVTTIATLALGMAAAVAIFAFVDAALIKPLPYFQPSRLVGVFERVEAFPQSNLSYADYLDWKKLNTVFMSLAAYQGTGVTLTTSDGVERASAARVSDDFFQTLGVPPVLGRDFRPGEDLPSAPRTVMLSYGAWQKRYGGRRAAARFSLRTRGAGRLLVVAACVESMRAQAKLPQLVWCRPAAGRRVG